MKVVDICIISPWLLEARTKRGGGIEEVDYQVALQLSKHFNVIILGPYYKKYSNNIRINDKFSIEQICFPAVKNYPPKSRFELYMILFVMPFYSFLIMVKMMFLVKKKLKLVIVHNGLPGFFSTILAKSMKIQVIYSEGNTIPWVSPYLTLNKTLISKYSKYNPFSPYSVGKLIGNLSDKIQAQSNSIKYGMIKHGIVHPSKIRVIRGGVDINMFKPVKVNPKSDAMRVGFIGRLTDEKGALLLVEVIRMAIKEIPYVHFIIMGDGPYKHHFIDLPNVEHLGYISRNELNLWLSKIQIVLFFQKDLGLAVLEALSAGKAIIACNIGEIPKSITHLENGFLCPPEAQSYIDSIKYLNENPLLLEKISTNARKTAVNYFSWDIISRDWYSLCMECLRR